MCTIGQVRVLVMPDHTLDLGDDQLAQVVHIVRLGPDDHVVRTGDVVRLGYAGDLADVHGDIGGLADLGLDEDVSVNHAVLPGATCGGPRYHSVPLARWP